LAWVGQFGVSRVLCASVKLGIPHLQLRRSAALVALVVALAPACEGERGGASRKKIRLEHGPRIAQIVIDDLQRHEAGLRQAAQRIAPGFVKVQGEQRERDMRQVFKLIRSPKKGVPELVISPLSFIAAVGTDGIAIARDSEPDAMKGMDLAKAFPVVKAALAGAEGWQLGEFESLEKNGKPSVTIVMAAPARYRGEVVGTLVLGIPLWRLQQRLTKQLQMESAGGKQGVVLWVYLYRAGELFHHGTPRDLDNVVPGEAARKAGLRASPGGFTGELQQFGYWYGWGVRPLRVLGDDVGAVIFRMQPAR
jgi:hypothetical protein